jgi:hypothetical protein
MLGLAIETIVASMATIMAPRAMTTSVRHGLMAVAGSGVTGVMEGPSGVTGPPQDVRRLCRA